MTRWRYIYIHRSHTGDVEVVSGDGPYLTKEQYALIDPEGKASKLGWRIGTNDPDSFMMKLLDYLGNEGWEAVGTPDMGYYAWLLLKRSISN